MPEEQTTADDKRLSQIGSSWRSSVPFITFVVGLGISLDSLNYNIGVTVFPFQLEYLRYHNVSSLVGWLLFIYSGSLVLTTPVAAAASEHLRNRRGIMIFGQFWLLAAQILLMESKSFWLMCIGRLLQGVSSSIIITVGLALICDATPEKDIGTQLGFAMIGFPLGALVGPPVGGILYARWGYRAPFYFCIIFTVIDFFARIIVLEPKPRVASEPDQAVVEAPAPQVEVEKPAAEAGTSNVADVKTDPQPVVESVAPAVPVPANRLSVLGAVLQFLKSVRTLVAIEVVFFCSLALLASDVTITLHLQATWGLDSTKAGVVVLATVIPTIISSPIAGNLGDRYGPGIVMAVLIFLGIPWWGALSIDRSLVFFIISFVIEGFFIAASISPVMTEMTAISRKMDGVGFAHTYGVFNIIFGIGNAAGSVLAGQIYAHTKNGWANICYINVGILSLCFIQVAAFSDEDPVLRRWLRSRRKAVSNSDTPTLKPPALAEGAVV